MKNVFVLIILSFLIFSSCSDQNQIIVEDNQLLNNEELQLRSDINIGGEIKQQNNCGPDDYIDQDINCNAPNDETRTLSLDNGCLVEVTMGVAYCFDLDPNSNNIYVNFTNLRWKIVQPASNTCIQWWLSIISYTPSGPSLEYYETIKEIEEKFQTIILSEIVIDNNIDCNSNNNFAASMYFKSPCMQTCAKFFNKGDREIGSIYIYETPCAESGCCVTLNYFYLDDDGEVKDLGFSTETIAICSNFFIPDCGSFSPCGGCVDNGCGN